MIRAEIPLLKDELMKKFGYISYQLIFGNLDAIGIQILATHETVVITYRGARKVGFIYDSGEMPMDKVIAIFKDAPDNYNDIEAYEDRLKGKVQVLQMPKNNYVFVNDREVKPIKK